MQEERAELEIFRKQIEWVIKPYLEKNDYTTIKQYCNDFKNEDVIFRIFDENKNLIAASREEKNDSIIDNDSNILKKRNGKWKIYRHSLKDKKIGVVHEIKTNAAKYYLELTISEEDVIKSIVAAQKSIVIFFSLCVILMIVGLVQIFHTLRNSFNKLEDDVIEIANGNLDKNIDIPQIGLLEELTLSIKKMTQRLKRQIARLCQLEQYKSDFIQNISHEIKTPITAINSAIELIEAKNSISDSDKECFDIIKFQIKAINKLVNDILCLSEVEMEKTNETMSFQKVNLNDLIKNTVNYISCSDIDINFTANDDITVLANGDFLSTALSNLIINAIKYSTSEKIDIILTKKENNAEIQIKDYGIGIPKEHLAQIFERFYRVDKARSRATGGNGLGLAIVKNIVELHKGTICVESDTGCGCNFIIMLPLK